MTQLIHAPKPFLSLAQGEEAITPGTLGLSTSFIFASLFYQLG